MSSPAPAPLDLKNVQGDSLVGLPKKTQTYYFFQIDKTRVQEFRTQLTHLVPLITSAAQAQHDQHKIDEHKKHRHGWLLSMSGINIVFSHFGLVKMGIMAPTDSIGDTAFDSGMLTDAGNLGDQGTTPPGSTKLDPDWIPAFKEPIDGMVLVSGESHNTVAEQLKRVERIFSVGTPKATIHEVIRIAGNVRPGKEKGHEHFGFLDGISQPAVEGVDTKPNPGQETVRQGIILMGRDGDVSDSGTTRPPWTLDGSLLAFRFLPQLVPEFNTFLKQNPISFPGLPPDQGSELLGARLVGRWKSGAPVDITPTVDNPQLGADPARNNDFRYAFADDQLTQDRCPFAAHTRKTNPRADLEDHNNIKTENRRILRRGIPFGPEVSSEEAASGKTKNENERGLLFAAYQSNIVNGFQFIQHSWANTPTFPPFKPANITPGFDPIIGQTNGGGPRLMEGFDPSTQASSLTLPTQWVLPKGGEYFFSPSIPVLKETLALSGPAPRDEL